MDSKALKQALSPIASLLVICLVTSLALAGANMLTRGRIAELDRQKELDSLAELIPDAEFTTTDFGYTADRDGNTVGMIFTTSAKGYGGSVKVMTAVDPADGAVISIKVVDASNETVGLGQRATEASFAELYKGKSGTLETVKGAASAENEITAITGATLTSRAVTAAVNEALEQYRAIREQGGSAE